MKISELGEFGLIDLLAKMVSGSRNKQFASWRNLVVGIGDDTAAWHTGASIQLATVDTLVQDVHFSLSTASWSELGWKALAINLSDIAAMGGVPGYALVSLGLPGNTEVDDVAVLYEGMIELAQRFEVAIVGGNVSRASAVSITITVFGSTRNKHMLTRSAAMPGDKVAVTGYPGTAAAGLEMLTAKLQFKPEVAACLREAFLRPLPRIAEGQLLIEQGVAAAIDISDGLISDLNHVCKTSRVGARVEVSHLPIHPVVKDNFGDRSLEMALSGGEDYELLFTASDAVIDKVRKAASCPVTVIGEIVADETATVRVVDINGNPFNLRKAGWDHFT